MSILSNKLSMFSDNGINYMTSKNEIDFYEFDEDTMSLQAQMTGNRYQIGQSVNVVCMETDINKGQITFALC